MSNITLTPVSNILPQVQRVLAEVHAKLSQLLPEAEIEHVGATSMPGAVTKGDVDIMVRVLPAAFQGTIQTLRAHFIVKQPSNWTRNFASFGDDSSYDLPLVIQLVTTEPDADFLIYLRDYLVSNPSKLAAYNRLKVQYAKEGPDAYWEAKNSFLSAILASRFP